MLLLWEPRILYLCREQTEEEAGAVVMGQKQSVNDPSVAVNGPRMAEWEIERTIPDTDEVPGIWVRKSEAEARLAVMDSIKHENEQLTRQCTDLLARLAEAKCHCGCPACRENGSVCSYDDLQARLAAAEKAMMFVEHIQDHLLPGEWVACKICNKSLEEITRGGVMTR
jgi:hypothetical protein